MGRKKEIDRKATKGRKIRYVVHDKIQNFMVPGDNLLSIEGREHIINNLFGHVNQVQQPPKKKQRKGSEDKVKLI